MNILKCYLPSGAKGTVTGLLFKQSGEAGFDNQYFIVLPNALNPIYGKEIDNPLKLLVDASQYDYPFAIIKSGPNTGSGGGAPSIYTYYIQFENAAPPGL